MSRSSRSRCAILTATAIAALLVLTVLWPSQSYAAPAKLLSPPQGIPGWLQDALDNLQTALVKTIQDLARIGGVLLWSVLKVCGLVGLFGSDFSALFGTVVTEALNAVISGQVRDLIRGSLMVSLGIFGLSLLARPFWPDLRLVSFQRAVIWGIAIQAYLVSAPTIYAELETWRVDLSEQVARAVSSGAIPGCPGNVVEVLLCITGTSPAEVLDPDLSNLPDQIPYAGSESVRDLYDHCVYNPPVLYGDPACDPANPLGDPWAVLDYAQDALGIQLLGLILAFLILAYGVLQISLGLAAGMMFVLFPVAAIFAFYLPLEGFPAGVIRNYISIFLKSVVLLTLAGIIIRLFSISTGSLAAMAAVGLVDLLLCFIMAKEALASLLGAVSFVGSSVSAIGTSFALTGGGSGAANPLPSPESRTAATMITSSSTLQSLMGAPRPFDGRGATVLGNAGSALGSPLRLGKAAVGMAVGTTTGAAGFAVGAVAAAKGADYGSLALAGSAINSTFGGKAGRGFVTGAGAVAMKNVAHRRHSASDKEGPAPRHDPSPSGADGPTFLVPPTQGEAPPHATQPPSPDARITPTVPDSGTSPAAAPLQAALRGRPVDLPNSTPDGAQRLQDAAARLQPASAEVQRSALELVEASHQTAQRWATEGRSPLLDDGALDPQFVEDTIEQAPAAAETFVTGQAGVGIPVERRLALGEVIALGVSAERAVPGQEEVSIGPAQATVHEIPGARRSSARSEESSGPLLKQLRAWRTETATRSDQKAFQVLPNATLEGIAAARPQTMEELGAVKGVGPKRLERYGSAILAITQATPQQPTDPLSPEPAQVPPEAASSTPASEGYDPALFEHLRTWRLRAAQEGDRKAFQVFSDATLKRIAAAQPTTMAELEAVKGVGPKKLEQYGPAVLGVIHEHPKRKGEES